jgi:hypothetical protein
MVMPMPPSEYVAQLTRKDQKRHAREGLAVLLLEGLDRANQFLPQRSFGTRSSKTLWLN